MIRHALLQSNDVVFWHALPAETSYAIEFCQIPVNTNQFIWSCRCWARISIYFLFHAAWQVNRKNLFL
jgi:hypothetical protein